MSQPPILSSFNGTLDLTLSISPFQHEPHPGVVLSTFALNNRIPGPTLRVKPGDTLQVLYKNDLPEQVNGRKTTNSFGFVDQSNLHWHGLHVSGEEPSDDVFLSIGPGESYQYTSKLPSYHMPGTHWVHPHRHGSSTAQVGGGAAMAIIVEDPPNTLPPQVEGAKEILFFIQEFDLNFLTQVARESRDKLVWKAPGKSPDNKNKFFTVNGEYEPSMDVVPGEWVRMRIVFAGWHSDSTMRLGISGDSCEMHLLAKDGVYITDYPRTISAVMLFPGSRADVMLRCANANVPPEVTFNGAELLAKIRTTGTTVASTELQGWDSVPGGLAVPPYLKSLMNTDASPGCSCNTRFLNLGIDEVRFNENNVLHTSYPGAVVDRTLDINDDHPYHQHLYPFQLIEGVGDSGYFRKGDWQDTYMGGSVLIRYQVTEITGKMMVHCHKLEHEDQGMMGFERIVPNATMCTCTPLRLLTTEMMAGIFGLLGLIFLGAIGFYFRRRQKQRHQENKQLEVSNN